MPDNPFNNLSNRPDRAVTATAAVVFWLIVAALLLTLTSPPLNGIAAAAVAAHAVRTGLRFWRD